MKIGRGSEAGTNFRNVKNNKKNAITPIYNLEATLEVQRAMHDSNYGCGKQ